MKYSQGETCTRGELSSLLKGQFSALVGGSLVIEGQNVVIPNDRDLEVKTKYSAAEDGGAVTIKISWNTDIETGNEEDFGV